MATPEPGLDRHEWESELASLEEDLRDSPAEALPELSRLVERMLEERGYDLYDPVVRDGEEREVVTEFRAAREVADRVDAGEDVDPGDIAVAIDGLGSLFAYVIVALEAP
ncbi:MAG: hypothetical protein H0W87_02575 [Actinobacteria bacterium]|nr:hypothetical protein [Actinomycetota bacterium]